MQLQKSGIGVANVGAEDDALNHAIGTKISTLSEILESSTQHKSTFPAVVYHSSQEYSPDHLSHKEKVAIRLPTMVAGSYPETLKDEHEKQQAMLKSTISPHGSYKNNDNQRKQELYEGDNGGQPGNHGQHQHGGIMEPSISATSIINDIEYLPPIVKKKPVLPKGPRIVAKPNNLALLYQGTHKLQLLHRPLLKIDAPEPPLHMEGQRVLKSLESTSHQENGRLDAAVEVNDRNDMPSIKIHPPAARSPREPMVTEKSEGDDVSSSIKSAAVGGPSARAVARRTGSTVAAHPPHRPSAKAHRGFGDSPDSEIIISHPPLTQRDQTQPRPPRRRSAATALVTGVEMGAIVSSETNHESTRPPRPTSPHISPSRSQGRAQPPSPTDSTNDRPTSPAIPPIAPHHSGLPTRPRRYTRRPSRSEGPETIEGGRPDDAVIKSWEIGTLSAPPHDQGTLSPEGEDAYLLGLPTPPRVPSPHYPDR